jgi:hypothetical protein
MRCATMWLQCGCISLSSSRSIAPLPRDAPWEMTDDDVIRHAATL